MENITGIGERIKLIRLKNELTQEEFGKRIGAARNTVANYESENRTPGKSVTTLICREFGINEVWLRTGEGGDDNMFTQVNEDDRYSINLGKLSMSENEFVRNGVNLLAETDPEKLRILEEFMKSWLGIK